MGETNKQRYAGRLMMMLTAAVTQSVCGASPPPPPLLSNFKDKDRRVKMELEINQGYKLSHL